MNLVSCTFQKKFLLKFLFSFAIVIFYFFRGKKKIGRAYIAGYSAPAFSTLDMSASSYSI